MSALLGPPRPGRLFLRSRTAIKVRPAGPDVVGMRQRGRFNGGRAEAWKAALAHLRSQRSNVAQIAGAICAVIVAFNLPVFPEPTYVRGLVTGIALCACLWAMSWFAWVTSGLAFRIQGTFAEDMVTDTMRKADQVYDVIASLKFDRSDVDHVMITRAGIAVVETKWRSHRPSQERLASDAHQAASKARSVRNQLAQDEGDALVAGHCGTRRLWSRRSRCDQQDGRDGPGTCRARRCG